MHALGHLGELQRVTEENQIAGGGAHGQRVGEGDLAGLVDHEIVQRAVQLGAGEEPRRPCEELNVGGRVRERGVIPLAPDEIAGELGLWIARRRFLEPLETHAGGPGHPLDLAEEVVDGLVALRGNAHAPSRGEEVCDDPRARPRLPGSRRPLEKQIAPVQPEGVRLHLGEIRGLDASARGEAADPGPLAREDGPERGIRAVVGADRFGDPQDGRALGSIFERTTGDDLGGEREGRESRAAQ